MANGLGRGEPAQGMADEAQSDQEGGREAGLPSQAMLLLSYLLTTSHLAKAYQ